MIKVKELKVFNKVSKVVDEIIDLDKFLDIENEEVFEEIEKSK